jgi:hypothetical protein
MKERAPTFAKPLEVAKIIELLKQHCKTNSQGFAVYDDGWNDGVLARAVAERLNGNHVKRWREELFGKLFERTTPAPDVAALLIKLDQLERRVAWLEGYVTNNKPSAATLL